MTLVPATSQGVSTGASNTFTAAQTAPAWAASGLTGATSASRYAGATTSGAPASGSFLVGDFIIDQSGALYICTVAGSPGTWAQGGGAAGALTLLSTTNRATDGTFDVSGLSGAYNDLILVLIARGTRAAFTEDVSLRFNNDSGASQYFREQASAVATSATALQTGATSQITTGSGALPSASSPTNSFGVWECTVYGYASTTWLKAVNYEAFGYDDPGSGSQVSVRGGGVWLSTAAITRVQVAGVNTANLLTGSQLRIYGRL